MNKKEQPVRSAAIQWLVRQAVFVSEISADPGRTAVGNFEGTEQLRCNIDK